MTMPLGRAPEARAAGVAGGDLRIDLTHSLTPRFSALALAAVEGWMLVMVDFEILTTLKTERKREIRGKQGRSVGRYLS